MTYANGTADPVGLDATRFETRIGHEGYVRRLPERVTRTITAIAWQADKVEEKLSGGDEN